MSGSEAIGVLFVCLGNICRSPTAEAVFAARLMREGLADRIRVDSAGTGDWHLGEPPDPRSRQAARARGYDLEHLRARQVVPADFRNFGYILAMDDANLRDLRRLQPDWYRGELDLFLRAGGCRSPLEVPDPYNGDARDFERVLDLVEVAADGLLAALRARHPFP